MIAALADFDTPTAMGILARAAIALDDEANPAARAKLPHEDRIRSALLKEVREKIGAAGDADLSVSIVGRITDVLDQELDSLSATANYDHVLDELGKRGELPSDLYYAVTNKVVVDLYKKHAKSEVLRIQETVRDPDRQESIGLGAETREKALVQFFAKRYAQRNPHDSFTFLVAGQAAENRRLHITMAWRLYGGAAQFRPTESAVDWLKSFYQVYGAPFTLNGIEREAFSLELEIDSPDLQRHIEVKPLTVTDSKGRRVEKPFNHNITWFLETNATEQPRHAFLVAVMNVDKYMATLKEHGW